MLTELLDRLLALQELHFSSKNEAVQMSDSRNRLTLTPLPIIRMRLLSLTIVNATRIRSIAFKKFVTTASIFNNSNNHFQTIVILLTASLSQDVTTTLRPDVLKAL